MRILPVFLIIICTACVGPDPNQVAPILFDVHTGGCYLDPSGRYIDFSMGLFWDVSKADIYHLDTLEKPHVPQANERYFREVQAAGTSFWVGPGVLFMGLDTVPEIAKTRYYEDGWFFDFENQVFTDVLDLPPPERKALIAQTNADHQTYIDTYDPYQVSPNGEFIAIAGIIAQNTGWPNTGNREEVIKFPGNADLCKNAWKPDGSGVYIVERTNHGRGAGPVRFLKLPEEFLTPTPAEGQ